MSATASLALACFAGWMPGAVEGQDASETDAITETIERYVVGWRNGDLELLADAFATEDGVVLWRTGEAGQESLGGMTFGDILERGSRPNPEYGKDWEILSLDVVDGQLAVAKVDISRRGGSYVDYLVLYKLGNGWRIVTKTFVARTAT